MNVKRIPGQKPKNHPILLESQEANDREISQFFRIPTRTQSYIHSLPSICLAAFRSSALLWHVENREVQYRPSKTIITIINSPKNSHVISTLYICFPTTCAAALTARPHLMMRCPTSPKLLRLGRTVEAFKPAEVEWVVQELTSG